ncbi:MAG TPA: helix-turn-helix transcriptional regulator [Terriglobales bacterium]|nr:helix-turn-helix transcriptional regulator [Terriglobales bacterium]
MNIPDYVAPIVGYRAWQWNCTGWNPHSAPLKSFNDEWWSPGRAIAATCNASFGWSERGAEVVHQRHEAPQAACTCGIYAAKSLDQLRDLGYLRRGIRGEVYLWGIVIEHQSGWRAQFAYPKTLVLSDESLPYEGFAQLESGNAELMTYLDSLTAYGTDMFWAGEKKETILWSSRSGYETVGLESLHEALRRKSSVMWGADGLRSDTHLPVFKGSSRLSPRELKIVKYLAQGLNNREISQRTGIGYLTLKSCLFRIFDKLGVSSRLELLSLTLSKTSRC